MMNRRLFGLLAVCGLAALIVGCVSTVDGRKRAAWPLVKDSVAGKYERPVAQVFAAAREILKFNGMLTSENTINHSLEAKVNTRTVWARVDEVDAKVTAVTVQVRTKSGGSDLDLAHEIEKQIALKLQ
jgi:hypothetical protein